MSISQIVPRAAVGEPQPASAATKPPARQVEVLVTSDPIGADVYLEGKRIGATPVTMFVPAATLVSYRVVAQEPYAEYKLYKEFRGTINTPDPTSVSVWLDRTTAQEQQAARAAYATAQRAEAEARVRAGPWRLVRSADAISDRDESYIWTPATSYPSILERDARLYVRCDQTDRTRSRGVVVIFDADTYLGSDPRADYRVDNRTAQQRRRWTGSTRGTAAFVSAGDIVPLINEMKAGASLTARLYDYNSTAYDYTFNVEGITDALTVLGCYSG